LAVTVNVSDDAVEIDLSGLDAFWALQRHLSLPLRDIESARIDTVENLKPALGWRVGGGYFPHRLITGHFTTRGTKGVRQFWSVYRDDEVLVIETRRSRPHRVVLQRPDRDFLAWIIAEKVAGTNGNGNGSGAGGTGPEPKPDASS